MSENIPESVPTSQDPRSKRPTKKRALSPNTQQAAQVEALFANPDKEIVFPQSITSKSKQLPPPPEIVQNVQGSSAGAGSGEFHVYKASRRREYERLRLMDDEAKKEKDDADYERTQDERRRKDEEKTRKNREKRDKAKKRKAKGKDATPDADEKVGNSGPKTAKGLRQVISLDKRAVGLLENQVDRKKDEATTDDAEETGITIHDDD